MITIDQATPADADVLAEMIGEIEAYYGQHIPGNVTEVRAALFGEHPIATVLLARSEADVLGMLSYTFLWPAVGSTTSLYVKELFVRAAARRRGVGKALMAKIAEIARDNQCVHIDWTAVPSDISAVAFYDALGAKQLRDRVIYRFEGHFLGSSA